MAAFFFQKYLVWHAMQNTGHAAAHVYHYIVYVLSRDRMRNKPPVQAVSLSQGLVMDCLGNMLTRKALNYVRDNVINPKFADIAKVKSMEWIDKKLHLVITLNGLDDVDISIVCDKIAISPDGNKISVSGFSSNMPFAENALNTFAAGEYDLPSDNMTRIAILGARKILGI